MFYKKNDLFDHLNSWENYKEYLSKKRRVNTNVNFRKTVQKLQFT